MAYTEFLAKFDGLNLAAKNKVTLILPETTSDAILGKLVKMKGQQLHVTFEDPQQEMPLDEERPERKVMTFTTDERGVVQSVSGQVDMAEAMKKTEEVESSDDQMEGLEDDASDGAAASGDEYAGKEIVITVRTGPDEGQVEDGEEDDNLIEYVFPIHGGTGRTPKKFINDEDTGHTTGGEIREVLGLEANQGCYSISDLIGAGGVLQSVVDDTSGDDEADEEFDDPADLLFDDEEDGVESENDEEYGDDEDSLSDWEREILGESEPGAAAAGEAGEDATLQAAEPADLDTFILTRKPSFPDISYDFPALLERKKAGETWMKIANSLGISSSALSTAWSDYKKKVRKLLEGDAS